MPPALVYGHHLIVGKPFQRKYDGLLFTTVQQILTQSPGFNDGVFTWNSYDCIILFIKIDMYSVAINWHPMGFLVLFGFCGQLPLQLAFVLFSLIPLHQYRTIRIWIDGQSVKRVELTGPVEHVLIYLAIFTSQTAVQLPVWELPSIH